MSVAAVEVGCLHARYHGVGVDAAGSLDGALRLVADGGLAGELEDRRLPEAHAVCVREVVLKVDLDPSLPAAGLARAWAAAIAAALEEHLDRGGEMGGEVGGVGNVVVYEREVDVLVDAVRSVAAGDRTRVWAWQQMGMVDRAQQWPGPAGVAEMLAGRPALVPATLAAAGDAAAGALDAGGWLRMARAVRSAVERSAVERSAAEGPPAGEIRAGGASGAGTHGARVPAPVAGVDANRVAVLVPAVAWRAADGSGDRTALAVLALACAAPARSRDPATVRAVASAGEIRAGHRAGRDGALPPEGELSPGEPPADGPRPGDLHTGRSDGGGPGDRPGRASGAAAGAAERRPEPVAVPPTSSRGDAEPVESQHGGVLLAIHAVTDLDVPAALAAGPPVEGGPTVLLARILSEATGVPAGDPAVLAAAGWREPEPPEGLEVPLPQEHVDAVVEPGERLREWVAGRLGEDAGDDLGWVWARHAALDLRPGWIEATFGLHDVDLRLRRAGLDIDPGFVWWLGAVVRFRYV